MVETADGTFEAFDAKVLAQASIPELEAAMTAARVRQDKEQLKVNVQNAKAKVALMEAHLAGAKESLKIAQAELAGKGAE